MEEALSIEYQLTVKGQIQILSKDTIRASLGRSPDRLDSVVMAFAHSPLGQVRTPTQIHEFRF